MAVVIVKKKMCFVKKYCVYIHLSLCYGTSLRVGVVYVSSSITITTDFVLTHFPFTSLLLYISILVSVVFHIFIIYTLKAENNEKNFISACFCSMYETVSHKQSGEANTQKHCNCHHIELNNQSKMDPNWGTWWLSG